MEEQRGEQALDLGRFEQWATGDAGRLCHIVEVYQQTLTEALTRAREALAANNGTALKRAAHDLKNCFQLVSARNATSCAESIEQWGEVSDMAEARSLMAQIERCAQQTLQAMRDLAARGT